MSRRPSLSQNRILITGGSSGIGEQLARQFAAHQARVLVVARREDRLQSLQQEHSATEFHYLVGDVAAAETRKRIAEWIDRQWGGLDVLVNNAGIAEASPLAETSLESYRRVIDVNQVGVFLGMRAVIPAMTEVGGGSILNISSIDGLVGMNGVVSYVASKWAVRGMTKTAARGL